MLARMQPTIAHISIHALREEGDVLTSIKDNHPRIFLSTPSARRATQTNTTYEFTKSDFYPRPPRGGRPAGCLADLFPAGFLSTPSARRATFPVFVGFFGSLFLSTPSARRATPLPL